MDDTRAQVQEYYGKTLAGSDDLQTSACCCSADALPAQARAVLPEIADEIQERFYGCGSPIPPLLAGATVLDLGCGTGRDSYIVAKLVGAGGKVIGVDMTAEQIEVARRYEDEQRARFGYCCKNTTFLQGYIEDLAALGIEDETVDVVISNCVINLSPFKEAVFREIYRVLKPGGELYFSDVFVNRRLPKALQDDPVLRGECLGGALYTEDFRRMLAAAGWPDYRTVGSSGLSLNNSEIERKVGMARFTSATVRAFKLASLEDRCEDYGQIAWYNGSIEGFPHSFDLDDHHRFFTDKPLLVCGNTAAMLCETRLAPAFRIEGDRSTHFGLFDGTGASGCATPSEATAGSCC